MNLICQNGITSWAGHIKAGEPKKCPLGQDTCCRPLPTACTRFSCIELQYDTLLLEVGPFLKYIVSHLLPTMACCLSSPAVSQLPQPAIQFTDSCIRTHSVAATSPSSIMDIRAFTVQSMSLVPAFSCGNQLYRTPAVCALREIKCVFVGADCTPREVCVCVHAPS